MADCLGIYYNDKVINYAKLSIDNNKNITLDKYGFKFIRNEISQEIEEIIKESNSFNIPIIINPTKDIYYYTQVFEQAQDKSYIPGIMKMEYEGWCEKNAKSPDKFSYVYTLSQIKNNDNKRNAVLNITSKKDIDDTLSLNGNISAICPVEPIISRLAPVDIENYVVINLDNNLSISVVQKNKQLQFKKYPIGMGQILNEFAIKLGSYEKAYDICKQLNVYTEGESTNDPALEHIMEPIFQEILREASYEVNKFKGNISHIYITGVGSQFTNVDLLFSQYFEIKCSVLKPFFIKDTSDVRYMSGIIDSISSIALAYEYLNPIYSELQYVNGKLKINKKISKILSKDKKEKVIKPKREKPNKEKSINTSIKDKRTDILVCSAIVLVIFLISYVVFSSIYASSVEKMIKNMNAKKQNIITETAKVNSDISYINKNKDEYKSINNNVEDIKNQLENNQISRYSTYNVAALLQNIIKVIPQNVQLINISSDDNKYVKITASSASYSDLGYFVAELKLERVLDNIKINSIKNGTTTIVEIGGDLP